MNKITNTLSQTTILATLLIFSGCGASKDASSESQASLNWTAPHTRTDQSVLEMTEISAYNIYMGNSPEALVLIASVNDAYQMSYQVTNLSTGLHYFAVTTVDKDGIESDLSSPVSKTISI